MLSIHTAIYDGNTVDSMMDKAKQGRKSLDLNDTMSIRRYIPSKLWVLVLMRHQQNGNIKKKKKAEIHTCFSPQKKAGTKTLSTEQEYYGKKAIPLLTFKSWAVLRYYQQNRNITKKKKKKKC